MDKPAAASALEDVRAGGPPGLRPDEDKPARTAISNMLRWSRRRLPTGLYARSLLIIIIPMVVLQTVVAAVFMERHWQLVTTRLSASVSRDVAAIIDMINTMPKNGDDRDIVRIARTSLDLVISIDPPSPLPAQSRAPFYSILDDTLSGQIARRIDHPFWLDTSADGRVDIRIQLPDKNLRVIVPINRTYASNTHIFLFWMVGTSLVLLAISILFLRGQIRPILALADAAESFGKGRKLEKPFHPRGADEVRRAGFAFLQMRERIERQLEQRTAMLSGVSHDLRTILTRFKLQLAIAGDAKDLDDLNRDVEDMQTMLEGYLAFASGEVEEHVSLIDLTGFMTRLSQEAALHGRTLTTSITGNAEVKVRPMAFNRLVRNLVTNAWRHGDQVSVEAKISVRWLTLSVDDDGPGIPENAREDVFKPFFRLDEARNLDASGTGLGLAIARDIARSHGGNVKLTQSPMGGLRATVRIPV